MLTDREVLSTINMLRAEHLDVRTVTMGINLFDCVGSDFDAFAYDEFAFERKLAVGEPHRFARHRGGNAGGLKENRAWLDYRAPELDSALAFAHAGFGGLLGHALLGEHAHPHLAAALEMPVDGNPGGLKLR